MGGSFLLQRCGLRRPLPAALVYTCKLSVDNRCQASSGRYGACVRSGVYGRQSQGKKKSINEQVALGIEVSDERGWDLDPEHIYRDSTSASRFATKPRDDWPRVREAVTEKVIDVLILWESSRGDREPETWLSFLSDCRKSNVKIYVIENEKLYDMSVIGDWESLASEGIKNAVESEKISRRVKRGQMMSAKSGRPAHGPTPLGYRRVYDPTTGELVGQEPDPDTAPVVRDMFARLAQGESMMQLHRELGMKRDTMRQLVLNPVYIGMRRHNDDLYPGSWEPLVDSQTFYAVTRLLTDQTRQTRRPGKQKWLLSYLATCEVCGSPVSCAALPTGTNRYRCTSNKGCVTIVQVETDQWVERIMVAYLSQPEVYIGLAQAGDDADRRAVELRNEAATLRGQLDTWRRSAAAGNTTPESLAMIEAELTGRIRTAEMKAAALATPAALRGFVGPGVDVEGRWRSAPLAAKRAVIRQVVRISIDKSPTRGGRSFQPERILVRRAAAAAGAEPGRPE